MIRVETLYLRPFWRAVLSLFMPIATDVEVAVNVPFVPSFEDEFVMVAELPQYRARMVCRLDTGEIEFVSFFGCSVVGWAVSASPVEALDEKLSAA